MLQVKLAKSTRMAELWRKIDGYNYGLHSDAFPPRTIFCHGKFIQIPPPSNTKSSSDHQAPIISRLFSRFVRNAPPFEICLSLVLYPIMVFCGIVVAMWFEQWSSLTRDLLCAKFGWIGSSLRMGDLGFWWGCFGKGRWGLHRRNNLNVNRRRNQSFITAVRNYVPLFMCVCTPFLFLPCIDPSSLTIAKQLSVA